GGGAATVLGNLTMHDSAILNSKASGLTQAGGGGAVALGAALYNSSIVGNRAEATQNQANGGGLFVVGNVLLQGSTIAHKTVTSSDGRAYGGGVHAQGGSNLQIYEASTITGNVAHSESNNAYGGGINAGIYNYNGTATNVSIEHSSISGNTTDSDCTQCTV